MEAKILTKSDNPTLFNSVNFVITARAKEGTRYALDGVLIEKDAVIASDGRRLHVFYCDVENILKIPLGKYGVRKINDAEIILLADGSDSKFPKYKDIIPTDYTQHFKVRFDDAAKYENSGIPKFLYNLYKKDIGINPEYLEPLLGTDWDVWFDKPDRCVMLKSENKLVLIMPHTLTEVDYETTEPEPVVSLNKKRSAKKKKATTLSASQKLDKLFKKQRRTLTS